MLYAFFSLMTLLRVLRSSRTIWLEKRGGKVKFSVAGSEGRTTMSLTSRILKEWTLTLDMLNALCSTLVVIY